MKLKFFHPCGMLLLICCALLAPTYANAVTKPEWGSLLQRGLDTRQRGSLQESIDALALALTSADNPEDRLLASSELGASLLQARRLSEAGPVLREAYAAAQGERKARIANDLGNLASAEKNTVAATGFYQEAQRLGANFPEIYLSASLNLTRLAPEAGKGLMLSALLPKVRQLGEPSVRARYLLNLGQQAAALGASGLKDAHAAYTEARHDAEILHAPRLMVESLDALAQLYEDNKRIEDAKTLNRSALQYAASAPLGLVQDLVIRLEWRQSRLFAASGHLDEALAAMQRAASYLESIRPDLPIEVENGRTTYATLLQPIYVGLADLILKRQQSPDAQGRKTAALDAISALELSRQAEMQDYLGERCSVVSAITGEQSLPNGVAVLYPLVLEDRLELLLKWGNNASYHTVQINPANLMRLTAEMANGLRDYDSSDYLKPAQKLYDVLLRPLQDELAEAKIDTLIVASEGFLRPIPLGALHDGKQFLIEKYALSTVTGMTMTDQTAPDNTVVSALMAGLSEPGSVLDKLDLAKLGAVTEVAQVNAADTRTSSNPVPVSRSLHLRSMRTRDMALPAKTDGSNAALGEQRAALGEALKLPGVETELNSISKTLHGTRLLNSEFTKARFGQEATSGSYRILHIASHGIFGGDANSSFVLAYDDVLTMNGLQALLNSDNLKQSPIELLTLSACETAEGNERAPLGFSGAAIKAHARSALGTLWPVADDAARQLMDTFYTGVSSKKSSKATALRDAQIELMHQPATAHPFFWAPFTLVGNWK